MRAINTWHLQLTLMKASSRAGIPHLMSRLVPVPKLKTGEQNSSFIAALLLANNAPTVLKGAHRQCRRPWVLFVLARRIRTCTVVIARLLGPPRPPRKRDCDEGRWGYRV